MPPRLPASSTWTVKLPAVGIMVLVNEATEALHPE